MACDDRRDWLVHVLRRDRATASLVLAAAALLGLAWPATAAQVGGAGSDGVTFRAAFGDGARLRASTVMTIAGTVDPELTPLTSLRILTPASVDVATSGLGVASCRRPPDEIAAVEVPPVDAATCPPNSLMGVGSANAALLVEPPFSGAATLQLHSADALDDKPGLVVIANTYNPARFHLVYAGYLYVPPPQFGVGVAILVPQIPMLPFGAPIALTRFRLSIGDPSIRYTKSEHGRIVRYRPRGIVLPDRCPRGGFRFRLIARFAGGARRQADATAACPRRRQPEEATSGAFASRR